MTQSRPAIPEAVKREVRRRCCFGCVICGVPIFEYDHVIEYAHVLKHEADNLILLCELHHGQKTKGRLSLELIKRRRLNPYNKGRLLTSMASVATGDIFDFVAKYAQVKTPVETPDGNFAHIINIDFENIIKIWREDNSILIGIKLYDERGNIILNVDRGEIQFSTEGFDYNLIGSKLTIRSTSRDVEFIIEFAHNCLNLVKGVLRGRFGSKVVLDRENALVHNPGSNLLRSLSTTKQCLVVLPGWFSMVDIGHDGNICSRRFLRHVAAFMQTVDRNAHHAEYCEIYQLYMNILFAVYYRYKYGSYRELILKGFEESIDLYSKEKELNEYAQTRRMFARFLYREFSRNLSKLMQSVAMLEEIVELSPIKSKRSELARVQKSLAESLIAIAYLSNKDADYDRIKELLVQADECYREMFFFDGYGSDHQVIIHRLAEIEQMKIERDKTAYCYAQKNQPL